MEDITAIEDEDGDAIPPISQSQTSQQNPDRAGKWTTAEINDNYVGHSGYYPFNMGGMNARAAMDLMAIQTFSDGWPQFRQLKKEEETIIIDDPRGRRMGQR